MRVSSLIIQDKLFFTTYGPHCLDQHINKPVVRLENLDASFHVNPEICQTSKRMTPQLRCNKKSAMSQTHRVTFWIILPFIANTLHPVQSRFRLCAGKKNLLETARVEKAAWTSFCSFPSRRKSEELETRCAVERWSLSCICRKKERQLTLRWRDTSLPAKETKEQHDRLAKANLTLTVR